MLETMLDATRVYDGAMPNSMECAVRGRLALPQAVIELHDYRFRRPQDAVFRSSRSFLDLALSPRPGDARGNYVDTPGSSPRALGDIIFIPADRALRSEWGAGEQQSICCGFDGARPDDDDSLFDLAELDACLDVRSAFVRDALLRLAREMESPGFCSELLAGAIWIEVAVELGRYLRRTRDASPDAHGRLTQSQIRWIEEQIEQPGVLPTVAELARTCGLSSRHFFRMFRASTGMTLSAFAAERRIDRAKALLGAPRPAIKEIAWHCGFETSAAFSAAFRRAVGVTPKEYRRAILH